jgi:hypothetical protein
MPPGPQGRPVICQAGGSPAGRNFASKHADTIIARTRGVAAAKAYRADISARMSETELIDAEKIRYSCANGTKAKKGFAKRVPRRGLSSSIFIMPDPDRNTRRVLRFGGACA